MTPPTPRLSIHARDRCAEMDVRTRRVKRIVQSPDVRRPSGSGTDAMIATRDDEPDLAVVYVTPADGVPLITTVVWRTVHDYERVPGGYVVKQ